MLLVDTSVWNQHFRRDEHTSQAACRSHVWSIEEIVGLLEKRVEAVAA